MAEHNRNRGGYGSSYQDWNEDSNRFNRESNYDDRGMGGSYGNRSEGGGQGRYGQDYGEGSTYNSGRYGSESEQNRGGWGSQSGRYDRDYDRGRTYGGFGDTSRFSSSRYDRDFTNYTPGGYQTYGGGTGYGQSYLGGGYGSQDTNYGYGSSTSGGYTSGYRNPERNRSSYDTGGTYGDRYNTRRWDERSDYGSGTYGTDYGSYGRGYGRTERDRDSDRGWGLRDRDRDYDRDRNWWDRTSDEVSSWFGDEDAERRRRMDRMQNNRRGRGPRNYQRSDERIREDINDRLSDDWLIDATDIDVTVNNGDVTLTGKVDERSSKRRAEDIAESVSGVKNVENRVRVESTYETATLGTGTTGSTTAGTSTTERTRNRQSNLVTDTSKT